MSTGESFKAFRIGIPPRKEIPLLGVEVTAMRAEEVVDLVMKYVTLRHGLVIANLNLHGVYLFHTDSEFAEFCERSDVVLIDGAPVAWAAREKMSNRVGSTDWLDVLMPRAAGLNILAVGGTREASSGAEKHMREHYPEVAWRGVDGYSCQDLDEHVRDAVAASDIVLVGMGMPLQEHWINCNRDILESKVVANVGGCFDYYSKVQPLAPRWIGRYGLEWLYRLARNPSRLAGRYLVEPFRLARVLIRERSPKRGSAPAKAHRHSTLLQSRNDQS